MKKETKKLYVCDECSQACSQLYGDRIDGKYVERCVRCAFKSRKVIHK